MKIVLTLAAIALIQIQDWRVIDGDTIELAGERIRILDIDTPETFRSQCDAEQQLGELAAARLAALLQGREIRLERQGEDRYGRTLAHVYVDERSVGEILIAEGYAVRYDRRRHDWCGPG